MNPYSIFDLVHVKVFWHERLQFPSSLFLADDAVWTLGLLRTGA